MAIQEENGSANTTMPGKVTFYVVMSSIVAASSGLLFGYSIGISGGVASMDSFLMYFFPSVYAKKEVATESNYCKFSDPLLEAFTSSMYIAGLIATFGASRTTQKLGRRPTMLIAGILSLVGVGLQTLAQNLWMLIFGRVMIGCSVGFGNQAAPIYLSEMAPMQLRGGLNLMFQLNITGGILIANIVNFWTATLDSWGWRLSFAIGAIPALLSIVGCLMLCETPNSLIERGHLDEGKTILVKVRGTEDVEKEFQDLVKASDVAAKVEHPFRSMLKRPNLPPVVMAILFQTFQQVGGINAIIFYSPVLFQTLGFGSNASLYSAVLTGGINFISTILSILVVDRFGRRFLLLSASSVLIFAQVMIGVLLGVGLKDIGSLPRVEAIVIVLMICLFVLAFAWSWGPMGWLIPSEIFPLEIRSAGQSITVCTNLLFSFIMAQAFLTSLCALKYGVFFVFGSLYVIMSVFVYYLVPETKGISIDAMDQLWKEHWFWKRIVSTSDDDDEDNKITAPLLGNDAQC